MLVVHKRRRAHRSQYLLYTVIVADFSVSNRGGFADFPAPPPFSRRPQRQTAGETKGVENNKTAHGERPFLKLNPDRFWPNRSPPRAYTRRQSRHPENAITDLQNTHSTPSGPLSDRVQQTFRSVHYIELYVYR